MQVSLTPTPDDDTAAAVIAAVASLIAQEQSAGTPEPPARSAWSAAAALANQGAPPARNGAHATWHTVERARRAGRWSYGIVGL